MGQKDQIYPRDDEERENEPEALDTPRRLLDFLSRIPSAPGRDS
jgi:hypothetical protein